MPLSREKMIDRMMASDASYEGKFYVGVLTTGIYCLPSCKARKPKPENVRFFFDQESAKKAGLRACLRCKPDLFVPGVDREEVGVERLVAWVKEHPEAIGTVEALAKKHRCGVSKIGDLFRRYYHTTPASFLSKAKVDKACRLLLETQQGVAEIAFESGFETLSAFYDNFRRWTGMAPTEYRSLLHGRCFVLSLPSGYRVQDILAYLSRDQESASERVHGNRIEHAFELEGTPIVLQIEIEGETARCEVQSSDRLPNGAGLAAHHRAWRLLALGQDPRSFEQSRSARRLVVGHEGLRIPQTATVFEGLVWSIVGQQVTVTFASTLRRRLIQMAGKKLPGGLWTHPTPEEVAELTIDSLAELQFSRRKAEYLIEVSKQIVGGAAPIEEFPDWPATKVERTLLAIRGIGPWSANYLMMRACGFGDCVPLGDTGLTSGLQKHFSLEIRPDVKKTQELMAAFGPFRSLATFHLWRSLKEAPNP